MISDVQHVATALPPRHDIFAVCWTDFVPLHIYADSATEAIRKAKDMAERDRVQELDIRVAAMRLDLDSNLTVLWASEGFEMLTKDEGLLVWCDKAQKMIPTTTHSPQEETAHG